MTSALFLLALSPSQPAPDQVKAVFEHYWEGQGKGIVIAEAFLCAKIEQKDKDKKYDCVERVTSAKKEDKVDVYIVYLLPKGEEKEIQIQAALDGTVRETKDVKINGSFIRGRTYRNFTLKKAGKWEFKIMDGSTTLQAVSVDVM